jgi:hypothetical protein
MTLRSALNRDWNQFLGRDRAKCRFGPSHESVRRAGDFWLGESSNMFGCVMGPKQLCPRCEGLGRVPLTPEELAVEQASGSDVRDRPCAPCGATGLVLGPHHPWRHDHPGPLPLELLK